MSSSVHFNSAVAPWILLSVPAVLAAAIPAVYTLFASSVVPAPTDGIRNKRICLLIAHPDDEAMFFAPTLLAIARPETGNHVKILCLSAGNAKGLGETRKKELVKSATMLGVLDEDDVLVVDSPDFQDSITVRWDKHKIASLLLRGFAPLYRQQPPTRPNIDVIITFDKHGASSHPNHISLYYGAREFLERLIGPSAAPAADDGKGGGGSPSPPCPVDLYTLTSVALVRKYTGMLDIFATLATAGRLGSTKPKAASPGREEAKDGGPAEDGTKKKQMTAAPPPAPDALVFASRLTGERSASTARAAMTQAHKSQMVWFRWGWIWLSRYMVLNQLRRETPERGRRSSG